MMVDILQFSFQSCDLLLTEKEKTVPKCTELSVDVEVGIRVDKRSKPRVAQRIFIDYMQYKSRSMAIQAVAVEGLACFIADRLQSPIWRFNLVTP